MHFKLSLIPLVTLASLDAVHALGKSEPIPEQHGSMTIVVGDNYDDIVLDSSKDVLLLYHSPTCGPCQSFAPLYDEVAILYENHTDSLVIAKVNILLNDVPDEIEYYPQLKLFRANKKVPAIAYGGERDLEEIATFVRDHGSLHVDLVEDRSKLDTGMKRFSTRVDQLWSALASTAASGTREAAPIATPGSNTADGDALLGKEEL